MSAGHDDARNSDDDTEDDDDDSDGTAECIPSLRSRVRGSSHNHYTEDNDNDGANKVDDEPSKSEPFVESQVSNFT